VRAQPGLRRDFMFPCFPEVAVLHFCRFVEVRGQ
jgi:hypothetical protein